MTPSELLAELSSKGISLAVVGNNLKCQGKQAILTLEVVKTLRNRKAEIFAHLYHQEEPTSPPD